jgi:hypothetical protein
VTTKRTAPKKSATKKKVTRPAPEPITPTTNVTASDVANFMFSPPVPSEADQARSIRYDALQYALGHHHTKGGNAEDVIATAQMFEHYLATGEGKSSASVTPVPRKRTTTRTRS